jgi:trimeric autotransporter adhesin
MLPTLRTCLLLSLLSLPLAGISQSIPRVAGPGDANWDTRFGAIPPWGQGLLPAEITSILVHPSGDLIVFGHFLDAGGNPDADRVARWDGTAWHPLGLGLPAVSFKPVWAPNGDIIAGLDQNSGADDILRWDGTAWQPLGSGLIPGSNVLSLALAPNGDIIACGTLVFAPPNYASLARWDGTTWTAIDPSRTRGRIITGLAVLPNGDIIVGADFRNPTGSVALNSVGRWDGATWHPLGSGCTGQIWTMKILPNGDLIVGGNFTDAGGNPDADGIARWDGTTWHALGTGTAAVIFDLALASNGDIIATGMFTTAGGIANTRGIARWDGTSWHSLGTGLNNYAMAVAIAPNGNIAVGGEFTACGDSSVPMLNFGIYQAHPTGTSPELTTPATTAWPNPAHTELHVQPSATTPLPATVSLRDATGRVVRQQPLPTGATAELTLDVADLPRGLYWLQTGVDAGRRIVLE